MASRSYRKFGLLVLFAGSVLAGSVYADHQTRKDQVIAAQRSFFDHIVARKYEEIDATLANDYIGTYSLGIIDRAHEIKDLRDFALAEYSMTDIHVSLPAAKTGVIAFHLHVRVVVGGKDLFEDDNVTCVWSRKAGKWMLSSQTAVKVPDKN